MSSLSRRTFTFALAGLPVLAACGNGIGTNRGQQIDARADSTLSYLFENYPATREIADKATGTLIMPAITKVSLIVGGGSGRGVLRVGGATVDYYEAKKGNVGMQIGFQKFAHVLFFMTEEALMRFRRSSGWVAGVDVEYAFNDRGGNLRADTTTTTAPVVALIFGQEGFLLGVSLEGTKYTRIIP